MTDFSNVVYYINHPKDVQIFYFLPSDTEEHGWDNSIFPTKLFFVNGRLRRAIPSARFSASQHRSDTTPEVNVCQMEEPGCQYAARRARGEQVASSVRVPAHPPLTVSRSKIVRTTTQSRRVI